MFLMAGILLATISLVAVLLTIRKRREVLDLTAEEFKFLNRLQEGARPSEEDDFPKPVGSPLFSDRDHGSIRVYKNGIKARFVRVKELNLVRPSTGIQKRYVATYRTMFYPYEMIAGIYPVSINIVRKKGSGWVYGFSGSGESIGSMLNVALAYADDGPPGTSRRDKFITLQVETTDYRTAILSPSISKGVCDLKAIMQALGLAMGPIANQKVRTKIWLRGFYLIFEEPGHYDHESGRRVRGDRTRVMLGDIHKHYALRSIPGYPQRRRQALETLQMRDVSTLDERLRT